MCQKEWYFAPNSCIIVTRLNFVYVGVYVRVSVCVLAYDERIGVCFCEFVSLSLGDIKTLAWRKKLIFMNDGIRISKVNNNCFKSLTY